MSMSNSSEWNAVDEFSNLGPYLALEAVWFPSVLKEAVVAAGPRISFVNEERPWGTLLTTWRGSTSIIENIHIAGAMRGVIDEYPTTFIILGYAAKKSVMKDLLSFLARIPLYPALDYISRWESGEEVDPSLATMFTAIYQGIQEFMRSKSTMITAVKNEYQYILEPLVQQTSLRNQLGLVAKPDGVFSLTDMANALGLGDLEQVSLCTTKVWTMIADAQKYTYLAEFLRDWRDSDGLTAMQVAQSFIIESNRYLNMGVLMQELGKK